MGRMKKLYEVYAESHDITTLFEDTYNDRGDIISTEVVGFYYGEPDAKATKEFYRNLKAEF
jgi:hypothetical protein